MPITVSPRASNCSATSQPMNPAVPVTIRVCGADISQSRVDCVSRGQIFDSENYCTGFGQGANGIDAHVAETIVRYGNADSIVTGGVGRLDGAESEFRVRLLAISARVIDVDFCIAQLYFLEYL